MPLVSTKKMFEKAFAGKYAIGGVETQLTGTPASESGEQLPKSRSNPDINTNPLDKKAD